MTKQLADLFKSFSDMTSEEQFAKIRQIRDTRSIERPSVAKKRHKKKAKRTAKQKSKAMELFGKLSPEEKAALLKKLGMEEG